MNNKFPYDTPEMTYDKKEHIYCLTEEAVMKELGINLSDYLNSSGDINRSTLGCRVLKRISRHLYRYIYSLTRNKPYVEYLLAKYPPCREVVYQALLNEVYYQLRNGDFYNSADKETSWANSVSPDTYALLNEPLPNGIRLTYMGGYNFIGDKRYREDY